MQPIQIKPIEKNITIRFTGKKVMLPAGAAEKVAAHWRRLVAANPRLQNGEVFTVTSVAETAGGIVVQLAETNYAHYLYSHQIGDLGQDNVRIIHSSALVVTADNHMIFGTMGDHTSRPGVIQCCGGGIDHNDIHDGIVDIDHNTVVELREELGIDPYDKKFVESLAPSYFKFGGPTGKMTVVYTLRIKQTAADFLEKYDLFVKKLTKQGGEPEFGKLFTLSTDRQTTTGFIAEHADKLDEYMPVLLRAAAQD